MCGMWGKGIKELGEDEEVHQKNLGDGDLSFGMWRKEWKKMHFVCDLMENG